ESVRQVLDYLKRDEVDAGFVYATDAVKGGDRVAVIAEIPLEKPVTYPVAVLKGTAHRQEAEAFLVFLAGPEGKRILEARGFKVD
ncbi:MAG TPA: extracellular solute-binding protein, partial [Desulfomicrobiaceae bacterium]|nr:extracellular solute-binding protein [Desulfomicrobiaceae bacterium]